MADQHDSLRDALDELQRQLENLRQREPAVAAQLEATINQARTALEGQELAAGEQHSLVDRLSQAVQRYEASHPSLSANLGSIIDALAQMGI
jgi:prefoldin subunit 5